MSCEAALRSSTWQRRLDVSLARPLAGRAARRPVEDDEVWHAAAQRIACHSHGRPPVAHPVTDKACPDFTCISNMSVRLGSGFYMIGCSPVARMFATWCGPKRTLQEFRLRCKVGFGVCGELCPLTSTDVAGSTRAPCVLHGIFVAVLEL